jgi:hypothetical protein
VKNLRNQSLPLRTFNADCEQEAPIVEKTLIKGLFDLFNTFLNRFKSLLLTYRVDITHVISYAKSKIHAFVPNPLIILNCF